MNEQQQEEPEIVTIGKIWRNFPAWRRRLSLWVVSGLRDRGSPLGARLFRTFQAQGHRAGYCLMLLVSGYLWNRSRWNCKHKTTGSSNKEQPSSRPQEEEKQQ